MGKISYSGVVLDEKSRTLLLQKVGKLIPSGWKIIAHHMTINLGELKPEWKRELDSTVYLRVSTFAIDDKVAAVGVSGFHSINSNPHITIGVNRSGGGKPFQSNNLKDWKPISQITGDIPFMLTGVVKEIEY